MILGINHAVFIILSIGIASYITNNMYHKKRTKNTKTEPKRKEIHDVIIFSEESIELKKSKHSRCMITVSMDKLLVYLSLPRQTIDICIYVFTNVDLANAIMKLHYKNVKIRIIVDADMAFSSGSHIKRFEKHGIPVRWMKSTNLMHHKFCVIDAIDEDSVAIPFVMTGSLNYTNQALNGNWEDILVTSQEVIVKSYKNEFERLWNKFKPIVNY